MKKIIKILYVFLIFGGLINAQTTFKAQLSANKVEVGGTFTVTYLVEKNSGLNTFIEEDKIIFPFFKDFTEVGSSQSSNISIINNQSKAEVSYVKTYQAKKVGTFNIPPAKLLGKKTLFSNALKISVIASNNQNKNQSNGLNSNNNSIENTNNNKSTFLKWVVNKTNPYVYESVKLGLRVYSKEIEIINSIQAINPPKFKGLNVHLIENKTTQLELQTENINGEEYGFVTLQEWIVLPQSDGKTTIEPAQVEAISYSNFYNDELITLSSDLLVINVKKLPQNPPNGFNGAVGEFKINTFLDKKQLKKGESLVYEIELVGNGNFDILKIPEPKLNDSLEIFSPKERQNFTASQKGLTGKLVLSYLLVPQYQGKINIPSASFTYFDIEDEAYKTISSAKNSLFVSQEKKVENKEIVGKIENNKFLDNINNKLILGLFLLFILSYAIYKLIKLTQTKKIEITKMQEDKTEVLATKIVDKPKIEIPKNLLNEKIEELKNLAENGNQDIFYQKQETYLNLWLETKTNLPKSKLNWELAKEYFYTMGKPKEEITQLGDIIHTAKEAKYASKINKIDVNLVNEFNKMNSILNKF